MVVSVLFRFVRVMELLPMMTEGLEFNDWEVMVAVIDESSVSSGGILITK
jgi:hypothetical protein